MTSTTTTTLNANQPVEKCFFGAVEAAIWKNTGENGLPYYNATYGRRYKDKEGNRQVTGSYGRDASLILSKAADWAHTRILELENQDYIQRREAEQISTT